MPAPMDVTSQRIAFLRARLRLERMLAKWEVVVREHGDLYAFLACEDRVRKGTTTREVFGAAEEARRIYADAWDAKEAALWS